MPPRLHPAWRPATLWAPARRSGRGPAWPEIHGYSCVTYELSCICAPSSVAPASCADYLVHRFHQLAHMRDRRLEGLFLRRGQIDLQDALDAAAADYYRHACEEAIHAVFAFQESRRRQYFLAVERERLHHPEYRGARRIIRRSLHQVHDLGAAVTGAHFDFVQPRSLDQLIYRLAADRGVAANRHHVVAMPTEHHRVDATDRDVEFSCQESPVTRRVEYSSLSHDSLLGEAGNALELRHHRIQRIGDGNDESLRRVLLDRLPDGVHHTGVDLEQAVAPHPRFARRARGHHDAIRARDVLHFGGADHAHVNAQHRRRFEHIE